MNSHHCNNPGTSKSAGRSRGPGRTSLGYPFRFPMNATIASSAIINNGFAGGYNNVFPMEHSNGTSAASNALNNQYLLHGHPMVSPAVRGITDHFSGTPIGGSNVYTAELTAEYATTFAPDDDCSGNSDLCPTPSDFTSVMRHYEELNAKTGSSRKLPLNSTQHQPSNIEPKFKNVYQQTEHVLQRNVSQQTFPYHCNEDNCPEPDEQFCHLDVKRRKTSVESMKLTTRKINLKGVAGLSDVKIVIQETFLLPLTHPHLYKLFPGTVKRCCRCLLYGPPGTGKTLLAQAIASELEAGLYYVSCAGILSCYVGESEKNVRELFEHALGQTNPSIIFFDEIDSVCRKRTDKESEHSRRLKTELLKYFENPALEESHVYVLSATNCPWDLDPAFLRRFQRHIYVPLPDREARQQIIAQRLNGLGVLLSEEDWYQILNHTEGFSGSDLTNFVSIAVAQPIREILRATYWRCPDGEHIMPCDPSAPDAFHATLNDVPPEKVKARSVVLNDFLYAIQETPKTVTDEHIQQFENFKKLFTR
ncbi:Uncharacterized protein GBIM_13862 [Gryllus bimaculatus]|nr:Uncharacterized protein GBIM_13862 [Gryllus bimaculatus]